MTRKARSRGLSRALTGCLLGAALTASAETPGATDLDSVVAQRIDVNDSAAESQVRIDHVSEETDEAIVKYRIALQRVDALRSYNHQMDKLVASQEMEMAALHGEIDDVELVAREVTPLMLAMIDALENFIELDVPFLGDEREQRLAELNGFMSRSDITNSERYRRILEAYQIENEYGRTIETYKGRLELDGQRRVVEFLRIGRIAFLYQTLDGTETGVWDHRQSQWTDAGASRSAVRKGIRVARKQLAPDLLRLPVPAAEAAK
jgi:hypothetical protein